jgi:SHS2 domain-containing protein
VPRKDRGHETLEHTADVGLRVWASSLDDLFAEAAAGLVDVMGSAKGAEAARTEVRLEAPDLEALFVDWLSEVLFHFEARGFVPRAADVRVGQDPWRLDGTVGGPDLSSFEQHGPAVKAITYHCLEVKKTTDGYEARVYLDV